MNEKEKFIRAIKEDFEKEKNTKSYKRVQDMATIISENLYSEDSHFIYELIQNAQDNRYEKTNKKLNFYVSKNGILIKNNEKGFEENQISAICDFAKSTKKNKNLGYVGEKGIGFKSVFAITDRPAIHSNGYRFFFKKEEYIEPYWIENINEYPPEFQDENTTNIYLPYSDKFENKLDIEEKIKDIEAILLLFLNNLDEINIYNNNKLILAVTKTSKIENGQNIISIKSKNREDSFIVYHKEVKCKSSIKEEKRENVTKRELILAFPIEKIEDTRLFAFLPTEINTGLPFLIQADFLLTASRGDILKNKEWNKWLLDEIVNFFIDTFKNLKKVDKFKYLKYLEKKSSRYEFFDTYYQEILEGLKDEKLFLTTDNQWVSANEICILSSYKFMMQYLTEIKYASKYYLHNDFYIPQNIINLWNIEEVDKNKFLTLLGNNKQNLIYKFQKNYLFFEYLINYIEEDINYYLYKYDYDLNKLPLIPFDKSNKEIEFKSKNELGNTLLFYKLDDTGVLNDIFDDIKPLSQKYYQKLEKISFYSDTFGIKQPDLIEILENLNSDILNRVDNNVKLLVYIKNNLGSNSEELIELLEDNYGFLSKSNNVIKHQNYGTITPLYISKEYLDSNSNCIEKIVDKYCTIKQNKYFDFISPKYLEYEEKKANKDIEVLRKEWRDFFNKLKINDELKIIDETIEMVAYDSQDYPRKDNISYQNIAFITVKQKIYTWSNEEEIRNNINLKSLEREDSVFLFKKIMNLTSIDKTYWELTGFYREKKYTQTTVPWIKEIQNNYPIYIKDEHYQISDLYLKIDKRLKKFFYTIPTEYIGDLNSRNYDIFSLKVKPTKDEVLALIENEKLKNIDDVKNIFLYIKQHFDEIILSKIPIEKNNNIEYLHKKHLIWENGKELSLIDVKTTYGNKLKSFFIDVIGILEKPSVEQYIEYLKRKPKKYKATFYKFIQQLEKSLEYGKKPDILSLKLCKIGQEYYSFDEVIYNDERFKTDKIKKLLSVDKKYDNAFLKISDSYKIDKLSDFDREIIVSDIEDDEKIYNIYIQLLNFTWDYVFSKDVNEFEKLKNNRAFILETKKVKNGAWANIDLIIYVDSIEVNISQNIVLKDNVLYVSSDIDPRAKIKIIAQYISNQINISFEAIELFYKDVYLLEDSYTIEEYYVENDIEQAKEKDSFNSVFEKVLSEIAEENNNDESEEVESAEEEDNEPVQTLKESLEKNQSDGNTPEVVKSKNKPIEIQDDKEYKENVQNENKRVVRGHIRRVRTVREDKDEKNQKKIIRKFLYQEYDGHCQMCGDTFAYKDKNEFEELNNFKRFSLNRGKNRDVIRKGNSISLCLKHHRIFELNLQINNYSKIFKEYEILSLEDINKNENILKEDWVSNNDIEYENNIYKAFYRLKKGELFMRDNIYFLPIELFGKDEYIKFTKAHLIEFIEVWNEN